MNIKELIDQEDTNKPFSDDEIVSTLKQRGVNIARRTVAKYRQMLNIPSSRIRKQY
jgi:RNA polymerase sigma-54 factor